MKYYKSEPSSGQRFRNVFLLLLLATIIGLLYLYRNQMWIYTPGFFAVPTPESTPVAMIPTETPTPTPTPTSAYQVWTPTPPILTTPPNRISWVEGPAAYTGAFISAKDDPVRPVSVSEGFSRFQKGNFAGAIEAFRAELTKNAAADPAETRWFLAQALLQKDKRSEAVEVLEIITRDYSSSPYLALAWWRLGDIAREDKDDKTALFYYEKVFRGEGEPTVKYRGTPAGRAVGVPLGDIYYKTYCVKPNIDKSKWWLVREAYSMSFPFIKDSAVRKTVLERLNEVNAFLLFSPPGVETKYVLNYKIKPSDKLAHLAHQVFMVPGILSLAQWNNIKDPNRIRADQILKVFRGTSMIIVDKSAFTLDLYLDSLFVKQYIVGIGKDDRTPSGDFTVDRLDDNPTQTVNNVMYEYGEKENVVGTRWIGIGKGYGVHGTAFPDTVGKRSSNGCIRMKNPEVEDVYSFVRVGDKILIME